jgi:hypothetical protein
VGLYMWEQVLVEMLRAEIGDLSSSKFADSRLVRILLVSAFQLKSEAHFPEYEINISNGTIKPDPINDYDFSVLVVYKAACKILQNEAQLLASEAVMIKDGPSLLDTRTSSNNMNEIAARACQTYSDLLNEYNFMGGDVKGQAVLTPYSPGSFFSVWRERYGLR